MAGWKINKNTAETHNLILHVLSCHVLSGFTSFWVSVFSVMCLPSYIPTNPWFISQFNNINKKERNHVNDQLYFWKKPTVMYSQPAYGVSCSAKRQHHLETWHAASLHFVSTMKHICRTIPWPQYICRYNCTTSHGCLETTSGVLMGRCKSFPLMPKENFCWLLATPRAGLLGGWPWIVQHINIKDFSFLCDTFAWICQYCNIIFFSPQSLQMKNNTQTFPDCCAPAWMWQTELTCTM